MRTEAGPLRRWLNSWRLCLRLAVRDLRAEPRRTAVGVTAIALPLLVIAASAVFILSGQYSRLAMVPAQMGQGQAMLRTDVTPVPLTGMDGAFYGTYPPFAGGQRHALPGMQRPGQFDRATVERLTGGRLLPTGVAQLTVTAGQQVITGESLLVGTDPGYAGMATLTSGRWPRGPGEALLAGQGQAAGLPTQGMVQVAPAADDTALSHAVRIVGTVRTTEPKLLVQLPDVTTATSWIVLRDKPFGEAETLALSDYGFEASSRAVIEASFQPRAGDPQRGRDTMIAAMLTTGVIVVVAALVAPVFVVAARRGRWAISVFASNGATGAQRRRYLLAQALLVGVVAAIVAPIAGAGAGALAVVFHRHQDPAAWAGPLVIPWRWGLLVIAVAVLCAIAAALIPAVLSARAPLVSSMADQPEPRSRPVMAGVAVAVVLAASLVLWRGVGISLQEDAAGGAVPITVGGVLLFAGWLMLVPPLLGRMSAQATRFPVTLRVAVRDLARRRGRGVAVVGSVLATTGVVVAVLIPLATQRASRVHTYQDPVPVGQLLMQPSDMSATEATSSIHRMVPDARILATGTAGAGSGLDTGPGRTLILPSAGCQDSASRWSIRAVNRCTPALSTDDPTAGDGRGFAITGTPTDLAATYRLTVHQRDVLQAGGIVVSQPVAAAMGITGNSGHGHLQSALVTHAQSGKPQVAGPRSRDVTVAVGGSGPFTIVAPNPDASEPHVLLNVRALIPVDQVMAMGVSARPDTLLVSRPGGFDSADESRMQAAFAGRAGVTVGLREPPDEGPSLRLVAGAGAVLILLAVWSGTMLVQADRRNDAEVFQRLGADKGVQRGINAWYAATAALVGSLAGLVAGTVPGVAMAVEARSRAEVFAVPWTTLTLLILGTPLAAAVLAAGTTRGGAQFRRSRVRLR